MRKNQSLTKIQDTLDRALGAQTREITKIIRAQGLGLVIPGLPPTNQKHRKIVIQESIEQWSKLVGILFCPPTSSVGTSEILPNLEYFHFRSSVFVDFFCVGYSAIDTLPPKDSPKPVAVLKNREWKFSPSEFNSCRIAIESSSNWQFSGESDLLIIAARKPKDGLAYLDYSSAIVCHLEAMLRDNSIQSVRVFFEKICQFGEDYSGSDPVWELSDRLGIAAGGQALLKAILSLLPTQIANDYKAARHLAVSDISLSKRAPGSN